MSRELVQVVLRTSTSTSPDCSAVKRSFADSGTNLTLFASLKIAAAMARQTSTSRPVHLPCASGRPKPASVPLAPQLRMPRSLTVFRVWADALCAKTTRARASYAGEAFHDATSLTQIRLRDRPDSATPFPPSPGPCPARKMQFSGLIPKPASFRITERSGSRGQGVDACRRCSRICRPAPPFRARVKNRTCQAPWRRLPKARSSLRPAWSPPAAIPKASTASSIRRSITPRPCFTRPPRIRWRIARATNMAAAARPLRKRSNRRSPQSKATAAPAWLCCRRD